MRRGVSGISICWTRMGMSCRLRVHCGKECGCGIARFVVWHAPNFGGFGVMKFGAYGADFGGEVGLGFRRVADGICRGLLAFPVSGPNPTTGGRWNARVGAWVSSFWLFPWSRLLSPA